jgi:hypothetical protein
VFIRRRRAKVEPFEWLAPGAQAGTFTPLTRVARSPSAPLRAVAGAART